MDGLGDMDLEKMMGGAAPDMSDEDDDYEMVYEDLEVDEEKDVSRLSNGGVIKKVLVKGTGDDRPEKGSEVTVHYTGTLLDGTKFDSSVDRGDPFKFRLGVGQVIKGWDEGVASMKKGEKAILTCKPDYAYGARGSPPTIPPNSTLKFEVELFSWKSDNDLFNDGGVIRAKTMKKGTGYVFPKEIDEVTVTYAVTDPDNNNGGGAAEITAATDATFIVKDAPFDGLGKLLTKMKPGETSLMKLTGSYCAGLPGNPAAADVVVTLTSLQNVDPICDGEGTKKTVTEGEGYDTPNDGAKCVVSYVTKLTSDGTVLEEVNDFTFETGNETVPAGLEEAVMRMKKGEVAEVAVPAGHAYGAEGKKSDPSSSSPAIPGGADLTFTITMKEFEKEKEVYAMNVPEKIAAADKVKVAGNDAYKTGKLALASKKYDKALRYVEMDQSFGDDEKVQSKALKLSCYLNAAAVALKQKDWRKAQTNASKALDIEGSNEKALYRRAQAAAEIEEYEEAKRDIKKLLETDAKHREGRALFARIKKLEAAQAKKDAKVFGGMFSKLGGLYKEEKKKAEGGDDGAPAPKLEPIDIGNGFTMEEIQDGDEGEGEGEGEAAKSTVSKEFQ